MAEHTHLTRRVFISSTSEDLRAHRERVRDTLLSLGLFPVGMEQFGAQGSGDASSVSTGKVADCDVYLGIYAWRYGYVPAGATLSVTHQEYEEAARLGLPRYVFVADPATDAPDGPDALFPAAVRDPEHRAQLDALRAELLRGHVVDFFTTPEDLAVRVATALHSYVLQLHREELAAGPRAPHTLPPRAAAFVGRAAELPALCAMLRAGRGSGQSVALVGMAGCGKTTLAAEALHTLAAEPEGFAGGTTWVRCDGRTGQAGLAWLYDQLLGAWNSTLAPEEAARARTPEEEIELRERALAARLQPTGQTAAPALVLLDHVERDLPIGRTLGTLAPLGINVLITARHEPSSPRLRLMPLDVLDAEPASQLFAVRYADRGGDWEPARDATATASVVEALGRLPLAIELAAARAARAHTGVAALASELTEADRLGRLRDPLDPTRSVRYAFEQSLAALSSIQRARFAALGLPDGPDWPRPVIERLFGAVHGDPASSAALAVNPPGDDLEVLAALSLVTLAAPDARPDAGSEPVAPRARLHPLLRDLARDEWARLPTPMQAACLSTLLASVADLVHTQSNDFSALAREEDLIAGTLRRAARAGNEPREIGNIVAALGPYLDIGGHWRLGVELATLGLEACRALGDEAGVAQALNDRGYLAQRLGRYDEAAGDAQQALAVRRALGDLAGQGETLGNLGALARSRGQLEQARMFYDEALALRRQTHDRQGEGTTLNNLGAVAGDQEHLADAVRYHDQALEILRELGDRRGQGIALNNLGGLAEHMGRPDAAARSYEQALALLRATGDRATEGVALNNLGNLARAQGRQEAAASYYTQALALRRALGDRIGEGTTLHNQGVLLGSMGRADDATQAFEQALRIERELGDHAGEAATLINLGELASGQGHADAAARYYDQALELARAAGDLAGEATVLNAQGTLAQAQRRLEAAAGYHERALGIQRQLGDGAGEGLTLNSLGLLAYAQGHTAEARRAFEQALALLGNAGQSDAAETLRANLARLDADGTAAGAATEDPVNVPPPLVAEPLPVPAPSGVAPEPAPSIVAPVPMPGVVAPEPLAASAPVPPLPEPPAMAPTVPATPGGATPSRQPPPAKPPRPKRGWWPWRR